MDLLTLVKFLIFDKKGKFTYRQLNFLSTDCYIFWRSSVCMVKLGILSKWLLKRLMLKNLGSEFLFIGLGTPQNRFFVFQFRHSSMLKSAAVRLTQLADKMREKSGASKAGGGTQSGLKSSSSVMQPAVDTKNMVFKRKEMPPSDVAGDSRQPADATAKTKNVKRKSMVSV